VVNKAPTRTGCGPSGVPIVSDDPIREIEEAIRALFHERQELLLKQSMGLPLCTDEVPDNVLPFPYKEQAYVNLRQNDVGKGRSRSPYPH
jgi:hypothetical protein